jgi:hypothetical protein
MTAPTLPMLFQVRWVSGGKEGSCYIRAINADDAVDAFQAEPAFFGAPHEHALAVYVRPFTLGAAYERAA